MANRRRSRPTRRTFKKVGSGSLAFGGSGETFEKKTPKGKTVVDVTTDGKLIDVQKRVFVKNSRPKTLEFETFRNTQAGRVKAETFKKKLIMPKGPKPKIGIKTTSTIQFSPRSKPKKIEVTRLKSPLDRKITTFNKKTKETIIFNRDGEIVSKTKEKIK